MHARSALCVAVIFTAAFAGCLSERETDRSDDATDVCLHPYPCGDHWPDGLIGPFDLLERTEVVIPSHDGTRLHGWLWRPDLPAPATAPTILMSTPYLAAEDGAAQMEALYEPPILRNFIPNGYAYLVLEVRGTGASGGCFGHHDLDAQRDPAAAVEWITQQPWSNGRVGMAGMSYMGVTSIHGAIHAGPGLKAIAPVAVPQQYLYHFTPQGAFSTSAAGYEATQHTLETPPVALGSGPQNSLTLLDNGPERWCSEYARNMAVEPRAMVEDDRDAEFWQVRDSFRSYPNITAAVFISEGYNDPYIPWGQDVTWDLLEAPKRLLFGQWGHVMPPLDDTAADRLQWFDYWLKGVGEPPRLGVVDFQDDTGTWHESSSWPPHTVQSETLYLSETGLAIAPTPSEHTYQSLPVGPGRTPDDQLCDGSGGLRFDTPTLEAPITIAGNPMAWLSLESDGPSGLVGIYLYRIPAGDDCTTAKLITSGAADLRFHEGNLVGKNFPVGQEKSVRFDLEMVAARIPAGDRIAVLLTHPGPYDDRDIDDPERIQPHGPGSAGRSGQPAYPKIIVHTTSSDDSSHLRLPLVEGTLGGPLVEMTYPPRPFSGK